MSSSVFSPHTCLFPKDTRAGLDIQRRSEEKFHLHSVLLLLRSEEREKGTSQDSEGVLPVWLSPGPAKAQRAELKSPVCAAGAGVPAASLEVEGHTGRNQRRPEETQSFQQ